LSDFSSIDGCAVDAGTDKVSLITEGDHYIAFYEPSGTPTAYSLQVFGVGYADWMPGFSNWGNNMHYHNGDAYVWLTNDSLETGNWFIKVKNDGTIGFVFQESDVNNIIYISMAIMMDTTNDIMLLSSLSASNFEYGHAYSMYDLSTPAHLWIYAEELWDIYHRFYNDYSPITNKMVECSCDLYGYECVFQMWGLNPADDFKIIEEQMAYIDYEFAT